MAKQKALFQVSDVDLAKGLFIATWKSAGVVKFDFGQLYPDFAQMDEVQKGGIINGFSQKLRDAAAAGAEVPESERFQAMLDVADNLENGKWNLKREGLGGAQNWGVFIEAFAEVRGMEVADARELITGTRDKNLAAKPDMKRAEVEKAIIAQLCERDERIKAAMDKILAARVKVVEGIELGELAE